MSFCILGLLNSNTTDDIYNSTMVYDFFYNITTNSTVDFMAIDDFTPYVSLDGYVSYTFSYGMP